MLYQSLAALLTQPLPSVVSPKFTNESWLIMVTVISIRHDLPEDKMLFPSARRTCNKSEKSVKLYLPVYAAPVILALEKTNVRDVSPPKS